MVHPKSLSAALGVALSSFVHSASAAGSATTLQNAASAAGLLYFGTAVDNPDLNNANYVTVLKAQFGQITPANAMKWGSTETANGVYNYAQADQIANLAKTNNQFLRCHNLVWYQQAPSFITSGSWTNATLIQAMTDHITNIVTRYKGQCYAWDVVNEALNDDGTLRQWQLSNIIGPAYIPLAFKAAAAADPDAKLYYNDYNIESPGAKATAAQNLVKSIRAAGAKIDGVGLESHFIAGETPSESTQSANMNTFTGLDLDVAVTELDVRMTLPETSAGDQQQAKDYVSTVSACLSVARCVGVTVWDFDDQFSWVPGTFPGQGAADLYNSALQPKPAYTSVLSALNSASGLRTATASVPAATSPGTTLTTSTVAGATATPTTSGTVAEWGQCGGIGWTGGTVCQSPFTCTPLNDFYSQCL